MQADGALSPFARIADVMHRIQRVHRYRVRRRDLDDIGGHDIAAMGGKVLGDKRKFCTARRPIGAAIQQFCPW